MLVKGSTSHVYVNRFVPARFPSIELFGDIVGSSFSTAVVGYAVSVSVAKVYATKHDYKIDGNQVCVKKHQSCKQNMCLHLTCEKWNDFLKKSICMHVCM